MDSIKKSEILEREGFVYNFVRMLYINDKKKKIFSHEAIDKNDVYWLAGRILEDSIPKDWQFYFYKGIPSNELKHDILNDIT